MTEPREPTPHVFFDERGSGPPVVLLHGLGDDHRTWDPIVRLLAPSYRCIAVDLRGHGRSVGATSFKLDEYSRDILELLARLDVVEPTLVGHSLGGVVAAQVASECAVRAVVCVDQVLDFAVLSAMVAPVANVVRHGDHIGLLASVVDTLGWGSIDEESKRGIVARRATLRREVILDTWAPFLERDAANELGGTSAPFLAIHGREPGPEYRAWLKQRMPQARLEVWEHGGHYPHLSEPQRFAEVVSALAERRSG